MPEITSDPRWYRATKEITMKFDTLSTARWYVRMHAPEFRKKLKIVSFLFKPLEGPSRKAWTVVLK